MLRPIGHGPRYLYVSQGNEMHFHTLAVLVLAISSANAADATYSEWATGQINDFVAGKIAPPKEKWYSWLGDNGKTWTSGVAFVHSKSLGDGILVVPDLGANIAYLAFKSGETYVSKAEAHSLGLGYCPYLTTKSNETLIDLEPDSNTWILSK